MCVYVGDIESAHAHDEKTKRKVTKGLGEKKKVDRHVWGPKCVYSKLEVPKLKECMYLRK